MIRLLGRVDTATEHGKEESRRRGSPAAHLSSSRVDWPAQPSLDLAQNYFSRISWIVSIVLLPPLLVAIRALSDLCRGIVSARLGHLDPWIPSYGHSLKAPDVPGAFFCSLKRGNRGAGRSLGTSGTRKSPA